MSRERLRIFQLIDRGAVLIQLHPSVGGDFRRFQAAAASSGKRDKKHDEPREEERFY
ncbi:hypothetical protein M5W83_23210 [Paenibacillus thiaminolyticus]|uniref:Uncharacterized protein n=1 Tax=Paenibacillus thiaminolyticus TaxID=49283 RepID=A0ABT4G1Z0_PANTH|nr:hypothetical protein [Paenibacillus thiaminolyticus]MCY9535503.1 hypothetical protein [Paenibacillus thiaminolyticus]MCY9604883.1 hypothetical protein [Paenibacillus thiaminolyticus]MCY9610070.1 hypothetical protein [Paenibacillus thiaminolyticus]MCY9616153.1 hypothetical protein [Paenibacillus thiaminolyticus]MCY9621084.1 hypothetical protein [Paenibacillus thiaminolyticus]